MLAACDRPLDILFRDAHLVVVNKPAGWLVHRTALDRAETLIVLQALRDQLGRSVWPLHRLDKGTSGALAFALDADTAQHMGRQFDVGDGDRIEGVQKTYRAIVRGWPEHERNIDYPLARMDEDMRTDRKTVQPARTQLRTLRRLTLPLPDREFADLRLAELELQPLTGRRHQLRRHMKHIAHPIIGDATHGKGPLNRAVAAHVGLARLWLHASVLRLHHPEDGRALHVEAPAGAEWQIWRDSAREGRCGPPAVEPNPP